MHGKNRVLWTTIAISFGAHFLLYLWLHYVKQAPVNSRRGVVSVNFVESVSHAGGVKVKPHSHGSSSSKTKAETAQEHSAETPPADPNAVAGAAKSFLDSVTELLGRNKIYPQEAIDREQEGKVVVGITLDRAGEVVAANLEEPSPFKILNDAALKTVRNVGMFPRVPDLVEAPIHLHVPLVFRIERN